MAEGGRPKTPDFGRQLARTMERRGFTAAEPAVGSELDRARVDQFLFGEAEPSATELLRLAGAMGVRPQVLLEGIAWLPDEEGGGGFWFEELLGPGEDEPPKGDR